jgi:hypothetical protein
MERRNTKVEILFLILAIIFIIAAIVAMAIKPAEQTA